MKKTLLAGISLFALVTLSTPAMAGGFDLLAPASAARGPFDPIVVSLPQNLSGTELNQLYLELDELDITQLVSLDGNRVVYRPQEALSAGRHKLRLVKAAPNDRIIEIATWSVIIGGSDVAAATPSAEVESHWGVDANATYSYLVADHFKEGTGIDPHNLAGFVSFDGERKSQGFKLTARGNAALDTEESNLTVPHKAELGEYLLTAEDSGVLSTETYKLGNHNAGLENLLVDDFYRRGLSMRSDIGPGRVFLTALAQDPAPKNGAGNPLGFTENDERAHAVNISIAPLASLMDDFLFDATLYQGRGGRDGAGTAGATSVDGEGNGWGLGLTRKMIGGRADVRAEYAHTSFDSDDIDPLPADDGDAWRLTTRFLPIKDQTTDDGHFKRWSIDAGFQRIGTLFQSLANSGLAADMLRYTLDSNYIEGGLNLDSNAWYATNDVDRDPLLPEDQDMGAGIQMNWTPATADGTGFWGTPTFLMGANISDQTRIDTPAGFLGGDLNQQTVTANAGVTVARDNFTWSFTQTFTQFKDQADTTNDYTSHFSDLSAEYRAHERLLLRPALQAEFLDEKLDGASTGWFLNLGAESILIPEKLSNVSSVSFLLNNGNTSSHDTHTAESEFTWHLKNSDNFSPGLALSLDGQYDHEENAATRTEDEYTLFARIKVSAPFRR